MILGYNPTILGADFSIMCAYKERGLHAWTPTSVRIIATPSTLAQSALFYVQEIGHFEALQHYFTEREQLESYLIIYTLSGEGRLNYAGRHYTLSQGQLLFIDCMNYQHYASTGDMPWEMLWVHVNGSSIKTYYEQYAQYAEVLVRLAPDTPIPALLRQLLELHKTRTYRTELVSAKLIVELLTEIVLGARELTRPASDMPSYIGMIARQMEEEYAQKHTLDQLARQHSVNKYHMAKQFKRYTGFSPNEYLIQTRITRAKELLKYSDMPISEIAETIGIDNVSHFITLFKDRASHTPLSYRKKWQRPEY
jgi:AraC-like DNA-binding protein